MGGVTRRQFLAGVESAAAMLALGRGSAREVLAAFQFVEPVDRSVNPLASYPNRDWESVYRDLYTPDGTFHYLCGPNDTHGCLLRASVKNGVVVYADPSYGYGKATDLTATRRPVDGIPAPASAASPTCGACTRIAV